MTVSALLFDRDYGGAAAGGDDEGNEERADDSPAATAPIRRPRRGTRHRAHPRVAPAATVSCPRRRAHRVRRSAVGQADR